VGWIHLLRKICAIVSPHLGHPFPFHGRRLTVRQGPDVQLKLHSTPRCRTLRPPAQPWPAFRASCTRGPTARVVYFLPRHLHELQAQNRADQQDPAWRKRYALRSGAEGTIAEFALGHQARRCRYHGTAKTHVQHVLTATAVNIERLSRHDPQATPTRRPTAFQ
jgi:hypothetical protein